jgi:hypothetical protein
MTTPASAQAGDFVICADDVPLGVVEADEGTHLRVRRPREQPPLVWVDKHLIAGMSGSVRLLVNRDELHDGVICMPPGRQREYATLEAVSLLMRRGHAQRQAGANAESSISQPSGQS